jgi:methylenetetrahydrofolate reductase (NADPH)
MKPEISFEFFPPQTAEGAEKLRATRRQLAQLKPAFFSCTFGAGGSTRDRTLETVLEMQAEGLPAAPHLSCIGSTRDNVRAILERYRDAGIRRMVALRGDLPSGMADPGEFRHANELVEFIRAETGDWFRIEVAAYPEYHPQARSPRDDLPTSSARWTPAPTRPSPSISTTPRRQHEGALDHGGRPFSSRKETSASPVRPAR